MHSGETIKDEIYGAVKDVTGIAHLEENASLIDRNLNIPPSAFLYIFDRLAERLQLPVHDILADNTSEVMSVANMAGAIFELEKRSQTSK